ncbi:hypothetical protein ABZ352_18505 [Streptomyces griseofuscus]|uniref:hypothetical protein n=1 Tax=Streptomyces griseofuscus TaxID=146922 RepID=UPI0033C4CF1F
MATFHVTPGLEEQLAQLIAPKVQEIGREVERQAKLLAPPTKKWITLSDDKVRPTHAAAHGQEVPDNLRFAINSMAWDRQHRGVGALTYMKAPRDESSRAVANIKHCRCHVQTVPDGISRNIHSMPLVVAGTTVTVKVVAEGDWVVPAEIGTVYPGNLEAVGTYFMARAAAAVAARR